MLGNTRWVEGAAVNRYTLPDDCTDYHAAVTLRRRSQYPRDFTPVARPVRGARARVSVRTGRRGGTVYTLVGVGGGAPVRGLRIDLGSRT